MKKTLLMSCLALLVALGLPWLRLRAALPDQAEPPAEPSAAAAVPERTSPPEAPTPAPPPASPAPATIALLTEGETLTLDMQAYLVGVVAAEMPASFPEEALKAQAVAARSYALYCAGSAKHGEASICADPGCCQAWQSDEQLRGKWGDAYEANIARIRAAVEATEGEYLSYAGQAAFAAFHSSSAGMTEDSGAIWSSVPYLVSVSSPETADTVPNYVSTVQCLPLDLRDTLLSAHPEADFTGQPESWVGPVELDGSGRVSTLTLGGVPFPGTQLRQLFRLRSTAFTLDFADGVFTFTVTGFGHGVGMSQYGAKALAEEGTDYAAILAHYYPGTELVS